MRLARVGRKYGGSNNLIGWKRRECVVLALCRRRSSRKSRNARRAASPRRRMLSTFEITRRKHIIVRKKRGQWALKMKMLFGATGDVARRNRRESWRWGVGMASRRARVIFAGPRDKKPSRSATGAGHLRPRRHGRRKRPKWALPARQAHGVARRGEAKRNAAAAPHVEAIVRHVSIVNVAKINAASAARRRRKASPA